MPVVQNVAPPRERPPELDSDHGPRLRAPAGVQYPRGRRL